MNANKNSIDMVHGSLWGKILKFSLVFMLTALLQELYSAADVVVVGRFAGADSLAGVGTCSVIVNLFLNFILGFAAGVTVVLGQAIGSSNNNSIGEASHTSIALAMWGGLIVSLICIVFSKELLLMIDVPKDVFGEASSYLRIVSVGYIPSLIYNFGAAILRAKGDAKRPLYIVTASGIINLSLNLLFVCAFKMKASGVALATVISQVFTACVIMYILSHENDETRIYFNKIRIYKKPFLKILRYGLPSGIQSSVYSISNILVQSSVNSFGAVATAGAAAVTSITNFYNVMMNSLYQAAVVFVSQNFGAKQFERIKKIMVICFTYVLSLWAFQAMITFSFGEKLVSIYAPGDIAVIEMAMRKFNILGYTYGTLGILNVLSGLLRGMGASIINMITSIIGVCGVRIVWLMTVFKIVGTFESLFWCYPVSWSATAVLHTIMFTWVFKKEKRNFVMSLNNTSKNQETVSF